MVSERAAIALGCVQGAPAILCSFVQAGEIRGSGLPLPDQAKIPSLRELIG